MLNLNYEPEVFVEDITKLSEEEWLKYRTFGIGGSDVASIYGVSPWRTCNELYHEKVGHIPVYQEKKNWVALEIGHRLEELVVQIFMEKTGLKPYAVRKMFRHPLYPFMLADIDFFVKCNGKVWGVECKTNFGFNKEQWANDSIPYHYMLQAQHYMAVTNVDGIFFVCLYGNSPDSFLIRTLMRDLEQEQEMIEMEQQFWRDYVLAGKEPPFLEQPDMVLDAIHRYQKTEAGKFITLPENLKSIMDEYVVLDKERAELEKKTREIKEQIKKIYIPVQKALGEAQSGELDAGDMIYRAGYTKRMTTAINKTELEKLKIVYPNVYDEYAKTRVSTSFFIKEEKKEQKSA